MSNKPRRPWIAGTITLLAVGLGHLYAGEPKRGLTLLGAELILMLAFSLSVLLLPPTASFLLLAAVGTLIFKIYCVVDASVAARKKRIGWELTRYNRWFVYVGYVILLSFLLSSLLTATIRHFLVQAFKIPSGAMVSTLLVGDHLLANKYIYRNSEPKRGDIILFPYPEDPTRIFIKRLVAIEGDVVEIKDKRLYLNGKEQSEPYVNHADPRTLSDQARDNLGPVTVPPGCLFVMGDNRDQSYDSRFYGFVQKDTVLGKAISLYWSWNKEAGKVRWERIGRAIR
ncbi:MAG: signal peptidase I [Nitrospirota bacterium]|nr:signal peptidase I [Nitrospirota bacterium]